MTDYLEELFAPKQQNTQEELAILSRPKAVVQEESPVPVRSLPQAEEPEIKTSTIPDRDVEFWQQETLRRLESALDISEGERERVSILRPAQKREGEGLERRLRRDSRRYDSGFFWY